MAFVEAGEATLEGVTAKHVESVNLRSELLSPKFIPVVVNAVFRLVEKLRSHCGRRTGGHSKLGSGHWFNRHQRSKMIQEQNQLAGRSEAGYHPRGDIPHWTIHLQFATVT